MLSKFRTTVAATTAVMALSGLSPAAASATTVQEAVVVCTSEDPNAIALAIRCVETVGDAAITFVDESFDKIIYEADKTYITVRNLYGNVFNLVQDCAVAIVSGPYFPGDPLPAECTSTLPAIKWA